VTVANTLAAFKTLHGAISGVSDAPAGVLASLQSAHLPLVQTIPGEAVWNLHATALRRQSRVYLVRVYVAPVAQGRGLDEGWSKCVPLLEAFGNAYVANPNLSGAVDQIGWSDTPITDSGITVLEHNGTYYHGFEYRVPVIEKVSI
jgi:hypothetical protein